MKNYSILLTVLLCAIILFGCSSTKGMTAEEKAASELALRRAIENRSYHIDVDRMIPTNGRSRQLTSNYSLQIDGDKVKSHLPYFGRAYHVPYGGGEGLVFESVVTDYTSSLDKKGRRVIEFKTKTEEDLCRFRLEIFPNGSASILVNSENRQSISYDGSASENREK